MERKGKGTFNYVTLTSTILNAIFFPFCSQMLLMVINSCK